MTQRYAELGTGGNGEPSAKRGGAAYASASPAFRWQPGLDRRDHRTPLWDSLMEEVAHRVDEDHPRSRPLQRLLQTLRPELQRKPLLVGVPWRSPASARRTSRRSNAHSPARPCRTPSPGSRSPPSTRLRCYQPCQPTSLVAVSMFSSRRVVRNTCSSSDRTDCSSAANRHRRTRAIRCACITRILIRRSKRPKGDES